MGKLLLSQHQLQSMFLYNFSFVEFSEPVEFSENVQIRKISLSTLWIWQVFGKVLFSQASVCLHFGGDTPSQVWMVGGTPSQVWMVGKGYPHPRSGWWGEGYPIQVGMVGGTLGLDGGGYPISGLDGGGYPRYPRTGWVPHTMTGWVPPTMTGWSIPPSWLDGVPPPPLSIVSTCYVAGGMPLAFMQENFLVLYEILNGTSLNPCTSADISKSTGGTQTHDWEYLSTMLLTIRPLRTSRSDGLTG